MRKDRRIVRTPADSPKEPPASAPLPAPDDLPTRLERMADKHEALARELMRGNLLPWDAGYVAALRLAATIARCGDFGEVDDDVDG